MVKLCVPFGCLLHVFMHPCLWLEVLVRRLLSHYKSADIKSCLKKAEQATTTRASLSLKEQLRFAFIIDKDLREEEEEDDKNGEEKEDGEEQAVCSSFLQVTKRHGTTS